MERATEGTECVSLCPGGVFAVRTWNTRFLKVEMKRKIILRQMNVWKRKCGWSNRSCKNVLVAWIGESVELWGRRLRLIWCGWVRSRQQMAPKIFTKIKKKRQNAPNYEIIRIFEDSIREKRMDRWILIGIKREPIVVGAERGVRGD